MEILSEKGGPIKLSVPNSLDPDGLENSLVLSPESIEIRNFENFKVSNKGIKEDTNGKKKWPL